MALQDLFWPLSVPFVFLVQLAQQIAGRTGRLALAVQIRNLALQVVAGHFQIGLLPLTSRQVFQQLNPVACRFVPLS